MFCSTKTIFAETFHFHLVWVVVNAPGPVDCLSLIKGTLVTEIEAVGNNKMELCWTFCEYKEIANSDEGLLSAS